MDTGTPVQEYNSFTMSELPDSEHELPHGEHISDDSAHLIKDSWRGIVTNAYHYFRDGYGLHFSGKDDDDKEVDFAIDVDEEVDEHGIKRIVIGAGAVAGFAALSIAAVMRGRIWLKEHKKE